MKMQKHQPDWPIHSLVALGGALMAPPVELHLVHRPHGALHILHPAEALVQGEVVSHRVLKYVYTMPRCSTDLKDRA